MNLAQFCCCCCCFDSTRVSDFRVVFRMSMIDLGTAFAIYSAVCFDRATVFLNPQTCVRKRFVEINGPCKFCPLQMLFFVFACLHEYILGVCVYS